MVTLQKVLDILKEEQSLSLELMAKQTEDTPEAVLAALTLLEQLGKVQKTNISLHCSHGCSGCPGGCPAAGGPSVSRWELKDGGQSC